VAGTAEAGLETAEDAVARLGVGAAAGALQAHAMTKAMPASSRLTAATPPR